MEAVLIDPLQREHWEEVKLIYESGIATGIATFETTAPDWETWDNSHLPFSRRVAIQGNEVVGWAALTRVSGRCVYAGVAEVSVYVADNHRGKGIGRLLLQDLISESEQNDIWTLQAGIFTENRASLELHKKVGFRVIGYRERIGKLNGTWKDNYILERRSKVVGVGG